MQIAICGYGKMGQRIRAKALEAGYTISSIIDPYSPLPEVTHKTLAKEALQAADVVIDFSHPSVVADNILIYGKAGLPAIIGTTGWYDKIEEIKSELEGFNPSILYSGNFSIGVALTLRLTEYAAKLFNHFDSYDVAVSEVHHKMKADSPSGTALMLANTLLENLDRKSSIDTECQHSKRGEEVIHLASERVGFVPGLHTVTFDSQVDTIQITHSARSRDGFAEGALKAAAWLYENPRQGFFSFETFVDYMLGDL